jgi:hypothetical protein
MVRASDARSARAHVRRTRLPFTNDSFRACRCRRSSATGRSSERRSLALRPRLTTGLPWTMKPAEEQVPLDRDDGRFVLLPTHDDSPNRRVRVGELSGGTSRGSGGFERPSGR